jgi:hypothetical protein
VIGQETQNLGAGEVRFARIQRLVDRAHDGIVLGIVHGPAMRGEVRRPRQSAEAEAFRTVVDEPRDVLALAGLVGLAPGGLQGLEGHHLDVEAVLVGSLQAIAGVVGAALEVQPDRGVDHLPIGERAVGGKTDHVRGTVTAGGLVIAVENVVQGAAEAADAQGFAKPRDGVVVRAFAGRDFDTLEPARPGHALQLARQHRRAGQVLHDLAGQPGGRHARLKDGEDFHVRASEPCGRRHPLGK